MLNFHLKDAAIFVFIVVAASAAISLVLVKCFKFEPDNPIEEICEEVIENYTGMDVDLTPESPEKGKQEQKEEETSKEQSDR